MEETAKQIQQQANDLQDVYQTGRKKVTEMAKAASEQSRRAMTLTDDWVRENPWMTVAIVAGAGLLIGLLIAQGLRGDD